MIRCEFRPWGPLHWLLEKLGAGKWELFGSIATGERSLGVWSELKRLGKCGEVFMLRIADKESALWGDEPAQRLTERERQFIENGGDSSSVIRCELLDTLNEILNHTDCFLERTDGHILIDISTLPKRFFFLVVRRILEKAEPRRDIIVTYTIPVRYDKKNPLSAESEPWLPLPGFQETKQDEKKPVLLAGLGYEPLGLPQKMKEGDFNVEFIRLLFPFPASPEGYLRNWEFVHNLEWKEGKGNLIIRVDGFDVSGIYDIILREASNGDTPVVFAPYGTKPMSLAMCLYACYHADKASVYYTQPKSYNPRYSTGIKTQDGLPVIYSYCIRLNGRDLYKPRE